MCSITKINIDARDMRLTVLTILAVLMMFLGKCLVACYIIGAIANTEGS